MQTQIQKAQDIKPRTRITLDLGPLGQSTYEVEDTFRDARIVALVFTNGDGILEFTPDTEIEVIL